ncbi:MAG TPA: hypothetical protein VHK69_18425 [Chitinophagaceae bacterium]|nr:hypothetical protein [Chitinophagaceae bacterium]
MKILFLFVLLAAVAPASAQYYYKDIVGTRETADMIRAYRAQKVSRVVLQSYDGDNVRSDDFFVEQVFSPSASSLTTTTRSGVTDASVLTAYTDASGQVVRTSDSSGAVVSTTTYQYDTEGRLLRVNSSSADSTGAAPMTEEHHWQWAEGKPVRMLRIKDGRDTTVVTFGTDEAGNVIEERAARRGVASEPVSYFYDAQKRLTDVVRYNAKARRQLPDYMFEYSASGQVIQKITVPAAGSEYLIWRYQYDDKGLKIREAVFNKQKQLIGKIEYQYQFQP